MSEKHNVVIKGREIVITINGREQKIIPCVVADGHSLGVGYFECPDKSKGSFWGLLSPHCLIQSWRGMKMLEELRSIENGTLAACWYAGGHSLHPSDERYAEKLARQFPSREDFDAIRKKILSLVPTPEELESMGTVLRGQGMTVSPQELEEEIGAGRLVRSLAIEKLIADVEKERLSQELIQAEIEKPEPQEKSLGVFFRDLDITLVTNPGDGVGWVDIPWHELDNYVKSRSLWSRGKSGYELTTKKTSIEQPRRYIADNEASYKFCSAKFCNDQFFVSTVIHYREEESFAADLTVENLRLIMGVAVGKGLENLAGRRNSNPQSRAPWWRRFFESVCR